MDDTEFDPHHQALYEEGVRRMRDEINHKKEAVYASPCAPLPPYLTELEMEQYLHTYATLCELMSGATFARSATERHRKYICGMLDGWYHNEIFDSIKHDTLSNLDKERAKNDVRNRLF